MSHHGLKSNIVAPATEVKPGLAVVIGRFQCLHAGHLVLIRKALSSASRVAILIGSSYQPRTVKNPFTFEERSEMIRKSLDAEEVKRVVTLSLVDNLYSDDEWVKNVQNYVGKAKSIFQTWAEPISNDSVILVGNKKDESSYYLDLFPQYQSENLGDIKLNFDATTVRKMIFGGQGSLHLLKSMLSEYTYNFLENEFLGSEEHKRLVREYEFLENYKRRWENTPYPVTFTTVDAVVKKAGHVLLVKRKNAPGEGLWALPGGFVNQNEMLRHAVVRELVEETKIDLPPGILQSSIRRSQGVDSRVFDHPDRDPRGRVISNAFLFDLDAADKKYGLPKVEGSDDAAAAAWFEISDVANEMREQIFGDHLSIIRAMLGI